LNLHQEKKLIHLKICVIGLGYVGMTLSLALAQRGETVLGIDRDKNLIHRISKGDIHLSEPGLRDLLKKHLGRSFSASHRSEEGSSGEVHIICVNTPISKEEEPDMSPLTDATRAVARNLKKGDLVVLRSTVSPGTTRKTLIPILQETGLRPGRDFGICVAPERTIEGKALAELENLPQIIGGFDTESAERASGLFSKITGKIRVVSSMEAAEMVKLVDNCYRYATFAIANELALACEAIGIDSYEVIETANWEYPRNQIKRPGAGVGGGCLPKDTKILMQTMTGTGTEPVLFRAAEHVNQGMPLHICRIIDEFHSSNGISKEDSKVLVLGFAFKGRPEVNDTRNSPGGILANALHEAGYRVLGYDPAVEDARIEAFHATPCVLRKGFRDATTVVTMNDNPKFGLIDLEELSETMSDPSMIFDGWKILDASAIRRKGITFKILGNGTSVA